MVVAGSSSWIEFDQAGKNQTVLLSWMGQMRELRARKKRNVAAKRFRFLNAIVQALDPGFTRAIFTTEKLSVAFHSMPDNSASAGFTDGSERLDCAFEGIKSLGPSVFGDIKTFVILIAAGCTFAHRCYSLSKTW